MRTIIAVLSLLTTVLYGVAASGALASVLAIDWHWLRTMWFARLSVVASIAGFTLGYATDKPLLTIGNAVVGLYWALEIADIDRRRKAARP